MTGPTGRRLTTLLLAVALDVGGAIALLETPATLALHPLAPPLTRIAALGDHPLGEHLVPPPTPSRRGGLAASLSRVIQEVGTPDQRARLRTLVPPPPSGDPAQPATLRRAIEADALAIAGVLGDARVAAIIARKEELADRYGEGRLWAQASRALAP